MASPGPVDVVVDIVWVDPEGGHVVEHGPDGLVGRLVLPVDDDQTRLQELGDVEQDGGEQGGEQVGQHSHLPRRISIGIITKELKKKKKHGVKCAIYFFFY
jgi:hypothetical protein